MLEYEDEVELAEIELMEAKSELIVVKSREIELLNQEIGSMNPSYDKDTKSQLVSLDTSISEIQAVSQHDTIQAESLSKQSLEEKAGAVSPDALNLKSNIQESGTCDKACKEQCNVDTSSKEFINCLKACNCLRRVNPMDTAVEDKERGESSLGWLAIFAGFVLCSLVVGASFMYFKTKKWDPLGLRHKNDDMSNEEPNYRRLI